LKYPDIIGNTFWRLVAPRAGGVD